MAAVSTYDSGGSYWDIGGLLYQLDGIIGSNDPREVPAFEIGWVYTLIPVKYHIGHGGFLKMVVPNSWIVEENSIEIYDLGVPPL